MYLYIYTYVHIYIYIYYFLPVYVEQKLVESRLQAPQELPSSRMEHVLRMFQQHLGTGPVSVDSLSTVFQCCGIQSSDAEKLLRLIDHAGYGHITCEALVQFIYHLEGPALRGADTAPEGDDSQTPEAAMTRDLRMTAVQFQQYTEFLNSSFPSCHLVARTELRGITLKQLEDIESFAERQHIAWHWCSTRRAPLTMETINLYDLSAWVIKPATFKHGCAFVELLVESEQAPEWFCSHWWGEPIRCFIRVLATHQKLRQPLAEEPPPTWAYWVCAYANRQHSLGDELTLDPRDSSFYKAMQLSKGILLILDHQATPFTRLWCAFEEYVALTEMDQGSQSSRKLLDIGTTLPGTSKAALLTDGLTPAESADYRGDQLRVCRQASFPLEVLGKGLLPELHLAQASMDADRRHILNSIAGAPDLEADPPTAHSNYTMVNSRLGGMFARAGWEQALVQGKLASMPFSEALRRDEVTTLTFNWSNTALRPRDCDLEALALGLPRTLAQFKLIMADLQMSWKTNEDITDLGLAALGAFLPVEALEDLHLGFPMCPKITGFGIASLVARFPWSSMTKLHLDFALCQGITDPGLVTLGPCLPSTLLDLYLILFHCKHVTDAGLAAIAVNLPRLKSLQALKFACEGCTSITDLGLISVGVNLPVTSLTEFRFHAGHPTGIQNSMLAMTATAQKLQDWALAMLEQNPELQPIVREHLPRAVAAAEPAIPSPCMLARMPSVSAQASEERGMGIVIAPGFGYRPRYCGAFSLKSLPLIGLTIANCHTAKEVRLEGFPLDLQDEHLAMHIAGTLPSTLKKLNLSFEGCVEMTDRGLEILATELERAALQHVHLSFGSCKGITDQGLVSLQAKLPLSSLLELELLFSNCEQLTDSGLASLLASLADVANARLKLLLLDFSSCRQFAGKSLASLKQSLQAHSSSLKDLRLSFDRCSEITDAVFSSWVEALSCACLETFRLSCCGLGLSDASWAVLSANLPSKTLQHLELKFAKCTELSGKCLVLLGGSLASARLRSLQLDLSHCPITDEGLAAVRTSLPLSLEELSLRVDGCRSLSDQALVAFGLPFESDKSKLRSLNFHLTQCKQFTDTGLVALGPLVSSCPLTELFMGCCGCKGFSDAGVDSFARALRSLPLQRVVLEFRSIKKVTDASLASFGANLPDSATEGRLDFYRCSITGMGRHMTEAGLEILKRWAAWFWQRKAEGLPTTDPHDKGSAGGVTDSDNEPDEKGVAGIARNSDSVVQKK